MKQPTSPLWQQMFSPTSGASSLTELRHTLAHNVHFAQQLEAFIYAEWCELNTKARIELNAQMRTEYQHAAYALAELAGKLFRPTPQTTERQISL